MAAQTGQKPPELIAPSPVEVTTKDGWRLKASLFEPPGGKPVKSVIVILPAMGAHARPYRFMASYLAACGHAVITLDPRGHGQSLPHPKRGVDYGIDHFLKQDIPAILAFARQRFSGRSVALLGHSLGGHLAAMYMAENPGAADLLITLTTTHVSFKKLDFRILVLFLGFSLMARILGYVPGQYVGWGTPMARRQVLDWARWGLSDRFSGTDGRDIEPFMAKLEKPLLSIGFTDDRRLAPPHGIDHFNDLLKSCDLTRWSISPDDIGVEALGHFGHLRCGEKVWADMDRWIMNALNSTV